MFPFSGPSSDPGAGRLHKRPLLPVQDPLRPDQAAEVETGTWRRLRECWQAGKRAKAAAARAGGLQHWSGIQGGPQSGQEHYEAADHPHLSGDEDLNIITSKELYHCLSPG